MSIPASVAAAFYDHWTPVFVRYAGTTLQSGLAKSDPAGLEDAAASSVYLARRAGVRAGQVVLDAGCGVGGPAMAIARGLSVTMHGVTVSSEQVRIGRRLIDQGGLGGRVQLHLADFHRLPFRAAAFDVVLVMEATCYSGDREKMMSELARVLRPGGRLYVKDVFRREGPASSRQEQDLQRYHRAWGCADSATISEVAAAMRQAGLVEVISREMTEVGTDHFFASMLERGSLQLNEFGRAFYQPGMDLPILWGEVMGDMPPAESDSPPDRAKKEAR